MVKILYRKNSALNSILDYVKKTFFGGIYLPCYTGVFMMLTCMRSGDLQGKYFHSKFSIDFEKLVYSRPISSLEMFAIIVYQKFCGKIFQKEKRIQIA